MATPIQKPQIPTRRGPIKVSEEARNQVRAGMGGEQLKASEAPGALAAPTPKPAVAEVVAAAVPAPDPAPEPVASVAPVAEPAPAAAAAVRRQRGRKPSGPMGEGMEPERSVKISESVWQEIRLALVLLPRGGDSPTNIKKYLEAAHRAYDAQLRKQGKLPPLK